MHKGKIEDGLHPKIRVEVEGKTSSDKFLALVDTGFDLEIALHHREAALLGLKVKKYMWNSYANGERLYEPVCPARVLWHGNMEGYSSRSFQRRRTRHRHAAIARLSGNVGFCQESADDCGTPPEKVTGNCIGVSLK